ncbi:NUDIX domain-containing protein [Zhongshania sp.]|jgi:NADH pyrophosphatase NudC (nudix superfamily)|uniref:NUDIX domain-containing protein n=1 Tax=Zhongshania sp. TaxID=1971902 RepID=UPI001B594C05|nr:NUDIX domain-containing protein [Zhongshania sp.]MBQ0794780.1 NUDIX domain-containing protein [Zhongshania sp.]
MNFCPQCASPIAERLIDSEIRKGCPDPACGFVLWNNPVPVVAMIVEVEGGVVMAHNVTWPKTFYSIITGFLEAGEDPEECARRETMEELNLHALETSLVGVYPFAQQNQVIIAYHVKAAGEIKLNHELDDYKIIAPADIKPWPMGTGLALTDWIKTQIGS